MSAINVQNQGKTRLKMVLLILILAVLASFPYWVSSYIFTFFFLLFIYIALAESYDFVGGYTGYINLGHIAFFGIGAYAFSLMLKAGFIIPAALLAAGIAAAVFAAIISYPFFRLRGAYYAIATIGLVFFLYHLALNLEITGGVKGISTVMPAEITSIPCYYLALGLAFSTVFISYKLGNSRFGLALISIREDEDTAQVFGVNSLKYKILTLILSAFFAGLIGGVYTWYIGYINPNTIFGLGITLLPVVMAFLGGSGHFLGPVVGAVFMTTVREFIWTQVAYFHLATYGLVLILVGLFIPSGIIRSERLISLAYKIYRLKDKSS